MTTREYNRVKTALYREANRDRVNADKRLHHTANADRINAARRARRTASA